MTGNDDRNRVAAGGETDRARRGSLPDARGESAVRNRYAVGNVEQGPPDALLKRRAFGRQRHIELAPSSFEIFRQLHHDIVERVVLPSPIRLDVAADFHVGLSVLKIN